MAKSQEVKLAVFGRAGVGKSGEASAPSLERQSCDMEAFLPPYVAWLPFHLSIRAVVPPRARFDATPGLFLVWCKRIHAPDKPVDIMVGLRAYLREPRRLGPSRGPRMFSL